MPSAGRLRPWQAHMLKEERQLMKYVTIGVLLLLLAGCCPAVFSGSLSLGLELIRAIQDAPEGEAICAVFEVIGQQEDGEALAGLLNAAAHLLGSTAQFTPEEAEKLIELSGRADCEFLRCYREKIAELEPPAADACAIDWVHFRLDTLRDLAQDCPSPLDLDEATLKEFIRLILALGLWDPVDAP